MRNVQVKRKLVHGLFGMAALALSVGLQFVIIAVAPQGWLATFISLGPVPTSALYPYNANMQVSLFSSPGMLYASVVPYSYALRLRDGSTVQKVPERLFAASQGLLFTSVYEAEGTPTGYGQYTTTVRAFRESDGELLWSSRLEDRWSAQLIDGQIYLDGGEQRILEALDPASGHRLWQYHCLASQCELGTLEILNGVAYTTDLEVMHGILYISDLENGVGGELALNANTGTVLWHASLGFHLPRSLLIAGGQVMAQTADNTITAFRAKDGRQSWQSRIAMGAYVPVQSTAANEQVAIFQSLTSVYALRLDTGVLLWQWHGQPVEMRLTDTTLYLASVTALVALDASTGQERWQQTYPHADKLSQYHPANQEAFILGAVNGIIYLHLGGSPEIPRDLLLAFRAEDGGQVWQRSVEPNLPTVPAGQVGLGSVSFFLVDESIYVAAYQVESTEPYPGRFVTSTEPSFPMTISVVPALSAVFHTTTFRLAAQALDGQTGQVRWHTRQVQTYRVA